MTRALTSFNYLAVLAAAFSVFCMTMTWFSSSPWWVPVLFIPIGWILLIYLAMPFWYVLHLLRGGEDDEALRIISIVVNLVFCIVAGFEINDVTGGQKSDAMELFCMGFAPLAILNIFFLIFRKQPLPAS